MNDLPPPVPTSLPPLYRDQRKTDLDHLRLLSIFSYVSAGLALLGLLFIVFHYAMMHTMFGNPAFSQQFVAPNGVRRTVGPPFDPRQFFSMFLWFYVAFGTWGVLMAVLNVVSGVCLGRHNNRTFSLVVAGLNCLRMPLGTALGAFTFVVLLRDSVRSLYEAEATAGRRRRVRRVPEPPLPGTGRRGPRPADPESAPPGRRGAGG